MQISAKHWQVLDGRQARMALPCCCRWFWCSALKKLEKPERIDTKSSSEIDCLQPSTQNEPDGDRHPRLIVAWRWKRDGSTHLAGQWKAGPKKIQQVRDWGSAGCKFSDLQVLFFIGRETHIHTVGHTHTHEPEEREKYIWNADRKIPLLHGKSCCITTKIKRSLKIRILGTLKMLHSKSRVRAHVYHFLNSNSARFSGASAGCAWFRELCLMEKDSATWLLA